MTEDPPRYLKSRYMTSHVCMLIFIFTPTCILRAEAKPAEEVKAGKPRKNIKLPGLLINFKEKCLDLEAAFCLDEGSIELVACTKGTKEHESIITVSARPRHIHAALLLIGAEAGHPMTRRQTRDKRWISLPPRGDRIEVSILKTNDKGRQKAYPISHFIEPNEKPDWETDEGQGKKKIFPNHFLFTGSVIMDIPGKEGGPRQYLSDTSGNVITIASFGDETLGLSEIHSHANGALLWQVNSDAVPAPGTKVTLRLKPVSDKNVPAKPKN